MVLIPIIDPTAHAKEVMPNWRSDNFNPWIPFMFNFYFHGSPFSLSLSLSVYTHIFVKTGNYVNICLWKTLQWYETWVWSLTHHHTSRGTCWIANLQDEHSIEETMSTCCHSLIDIQVSHLDTMLHLHPQLTLLFTHCKSSPIPTQLYLKIIICTPICHHS
mgnify:CR=1 FL=1